MSRQAMTMRCDIERDGASGTNTWNTKPAPSYASHLTDVACWAWSKMRRQQTSDNRTVVIEDLRAMLPSGTDIKAGDRLASVKNRRGAVLFAGPLLIDGAPQYKHDHIEVALQRHTGVC